MAHLPSWLKTAAAPLEKGQLQHNLRVGWGRNYDGPRPLAFALRRSPLKFWVTLLPYFAPCDKVRHKDILGIEFWETLLPYPEVRVWNSLPSIPRWVLRNSFANIVRQVCRTNILGLEFGTLLPFRTLLHKPTPMIPLGGKESRTHRT